MFKYHRPPTINAVSGGGLDVKRYRNAIGGFDFQAQFSLANHLPRMQSSRFSSLVGETDILPAMAGKIHIVLYADELCSWSR